LPKWIWEPFLEDLDKGFSSLSQFISQKGHSRVPARFKTEDGFRLGQWVANKRQAKKNGTLPKYQSDNLETLPKWTWYPRTDEWEEGFSYLLQFVRLEGLAEVPQRFKTEDGYSLGQWVSRQRRNKGNLSSEQIKKLEALEGWVWVASK
jgi:hypothetical protein